MWLYLLFLVRSVSTIQHVNKAKNIWLGLHKKKKLKMTIIEILLASMIKCRHASQS